MTSILVLLTYQFLKVPRDAYVTGNSLHVLKDSKYIEVQKDACVWIEKIAFCVFPTRSWRSRNVLVFFKKVQLADGFQLFQLPSITIHLRVVGLSFTGEKKRKSQPGRLYVILFFTGSCADGQLVTFLVNLPLCHREKNFIAN